MTPAPTGVDEQCAVNLSLQQRRAGAAFFYFFVQPGNCCLYQWSAGRIKTGAPFLCAGTTIEFYPGLMDTKTIVPFDKEEGWGYQYQLRHVWNACAMAE